MQFGYDYQGRRVSKVVSNWTGTAWAVASKTRFVHDGWNLISELNGTNNAVIRSYMWGSDLSGTMQGAGGVGGLLAFKDSVHGVHFVHYDGNGNVSALVNAADGTISAEYEYGPFGESMRAETLVAKVNPVQFSSKYRDQETDWVQYPFRYYIPQAGRWASRDPIGEIGGLNDYALLDNGPVAFVDPLGLFKPKYHREITLEALKNSGLSPELLEVIATANVAQDAGAIMGIAGGNRNKPFFDPVNHGDDNRIKETIARIGDRLKKAADNNRLRFLSILPSPCVRTDRAHAWTMTCKVEPDFRVPKM